ncbi:MAG TPA: NUDIX domain-containing protein [Verrucomicrobiae bacterium]|nr:NUDIX domain-containing protein [Verrucomicrobiae bacterium]
MTDATYFQYCPKQIVFSKDKTKVLLAQRKDEQDYNGIFSFIGGKTEITDESLLAGLKREKDEEIGVDAKLNICWTMSCFQELYRKKDGKSMVLPHHVAIFQRGEISLNGNEYAQYKWVPVNEVEFFQPAIRTTWPAVQAALRLLPLLNSDDFAEI